MAKRERQSTLQDFASWKKRSASVAQANDVENLVSCPVCGLKVALAEVNKHLDHCVRHTNSRTDSLVEASQSSDECAAASVSNNSVGLENKIDSAARPTKTAAAKSWKSILSAPSSSKTSRRDAVISARHKSGKIEQLSFQQARERYASPVQVISDAFPRHLADELAIALNAEALEKWSSSSWVVHNNKGNTNRLHAIYELSGEINSDCFIGREFESSPQIQRLLKEASEQMARTVQYHFELENKTHSSASSSSSSSSPSSSSSLKWVPSYILGNYYRNGSDSVGFHTDSLSRLGPRPIIAALSLGATRSFRWVKTKKKNDEHEPITFTAKMPHASVLIMWPPCQEYWKHSVPKQSNDTILKAPLLGYARISLTFRMTNKMQYESIPLCKCKNKAWMKYSVNHENYYFSCSPVNKESCCDFFQWR